MSSPKMSVEKHAVRLAEVYRRAYSAARYGLVIPVAGAADVADNHAAAHEIATLLVQQALNEAILAEWLAPTEPQPQGEPPCR